MTIAAADVPVGYELPPVVKKMTLETMKAPLMSGGNPIHYDEAFARQAGLPAPIATGMISSGYLSQLLAAFFGAHWLKGARMAVTYIAPVYAGDTVTARAVVKERAPEGLGTRLTLEIWCENQRGEKVTVGTASILVS